MTDYTLDAKGQKLGRIASEAAKLLMGKNSPSFSRNKAPDVKVTITNASKLAITEKKLVTKQYKRFSGYPGGLKEESLGHVIERRGIKEALRHAVRGMIPNNKLRPTMLKKLHIID
jgi:large subunit ribosomal protein L13